MNAPHKNVVLSLEVGLNPTTGIYAVHVSGVGGGAVSQHDDVLQAVKEAIRVLTGFAEAEVPHCSFCHEVCERPRVAFPPMCDRCYTARMKEMEIMEAFKGDESGGRRR